MCTMQDALRLFKDLSKFYNKQLKWEDVEELLMNDLDDHKGKDSKSKKNKRLSIEMKSASQYPMVHKANEVKPILTDLATYIRNNRTESSNIYDNTYDNWDRVAEYSPRDSYLSFIYTLSSLTLLEPTSPEHAQLSLTAVDTYFLSLTIPGAKNYSIFEESVIEHCLKVFEILKHIQSYNKMNGTIIWLGFITLSDDLKLLFRLIHFKEHIRLRNAILNRLFDIIFMNFKTGYSNANAAYIHKNCFDILDEVVNAHNGDVRETLMFLMNRTVLMHTYAERPKGYNTNCSEDCEHISAWFIRTIAKYPEHVCYVLNFYIEVVITNPIRSWKNEQVLRALDYAAKYDATIFTKCNKSCVEFLCTALISNDSSTRVRAIELISRILQIQSEVDWEMFRHEVSDIPREVYLIRGLIRSLRDINNNASFKAAQALLTALHNGSINARKIFTEGIKYANFNDPNIVLPDKPLVTATQLHFEKPKAIKPAYTFQGYDLLESLFLSMPQSIYSRLLRSNIANLRRTGILLIEQIVKVNPLAIYNTNFIREIRALGTDHVPMVRRQALISVDALLKCYPNCFEIICVWCHIWSCLISDNELKNNELSMQYFCESVLHKIKEFDKLAASQNFVPFLIIRVLLNTQPRHYLQNHIQKTLNENMINKNILAIIESHLGATTSTEAWVILNFISGKIKSNNPDNLISHFTTNKTWNAEINMSICLEVLLKCMPDFSYSGLNMGFKYVLRGLRKGCILLSLISKAMDFLMQIDKRSSGISGNENQYIYKNWQISLHNDLVESLHNGMENFPNNHYTFLGQLGAYSEVVVMLPEPINRNIIKFVRKCIIEYSTLLTTKYDTENVRILNWMIIIATRLSLREFEDAYITCKIYKQVLKNIDRPQIVNTVIISLGDLGKRHTHIVEDMFPYLLLKLKSPFIFNRITTFKCFEALVMDDQIKLRGEVLLSLLNVIVDDEIKMAQLANQFFISYMKHKNSSLFLKCLSEYPYILNEYANFVGKYNFRSETIISPLKGNDKRTKRCLLYNHFMSTMDDIQLVMYFGQLKLIAEKSINDAELKTPKGIAVVQDILFILRRICNLTKQSKVLLAGGNDNEQDEGNTNVTETVTTAQPATDAPGPSKRRIKQSKMSMVDALRQFERSLAYVHSIYENLNEVMNTDLQNSFDKLCQTLAKRFTNYIDYAQPAEFWSKYRKAKTAGAQSKRINCKRNRDSSQQNEDVGNNSLESDSENDLPLEKCVKRQKKLRDTKINSDDLLIEYIFNPYSSL